MYEFRIYRVKILVGFSLSSDKRPDNIPNQTTTDSFKTHSSHTNMIIFPSHSTVSNSNPSHVLITYFLSINVNVIILSPFISSKWTFSKEVSHQNSVWIPCLLHPSDMPSP